MRSRDKKGRSKIKCAHYRESHIREHNILKRLIRFARRRGLTLIEYIKQMGCLPKGISKEGKILTRGEL